MILSSLCLNQTEQWETHMGETVNKRSTCQPKQHEQLKYSWLKIYLANTEVAIGNSKKKMYLTKLSPTAHNHSSWCPWFISVVEAIYWLFSLLLPSSPGLMQLVTQHLWCSQDNVWLKNAHILTKQVSNSLRK